MIRTAAAFIMALFLSSGAAQAGTGDALAGHYYLQGVRETGSELLLRKDGRFEWFMAYGAADYSSRGRWSREGDRVRLVVDSPANNAPLFRVDTVFPWDEHTEARLRDLEADREGALAEERCPFLAIADYASAPPPIGEEKPARDVLERAVREALAGLENARNVFEAAAESAVKARAYVVAVQGDEKLRRNADVAMQLAVAAMEAYRGNLAQVREAHFAAAMRLPALPEPRIPAECGIATTAIVTRGVGVVIGDPNVGARFSNIDVVFEFSDGHRETRTTNNGGWALLRAREGAHLRRITVVFAQDVLAESGLDEAATRAVFDVDATKGEVFAIALDSRRAVPPMFERMELRIDGDALIPIWQSGEERGRYVRE